jgi:hypothetical protein
MNSIHKYFLYLSLSFVYAVGFAQENNRPILSPLNIPLYLSGNFGDLRLNHFHSGFDFRTRQKIGFPVFAVADGYVSRIKIENSGYGKAIYINHPNGTTSVYAHLNSFPEPILQYIKNEQYRQRSYAIDYAIPPYSLKIKKGELIAYSGNSGGSSGPHLHFEIRELDNQFPVNTNDFMLPVNDTYSPFIRYLYVYDNQSPKFNFRNRKERYAVKKDSVNTMNYYIDSTIYISGKSAFGLEAFSLSSSDYEHGLRRILLFVDSKITFKFSLNSFSYDESRQVNSLTDYNARLEDNLKIYKLFRDPNNSLKCVQTDSSNAWITFSDTLKHQIVIKIVDQDKNQSLLHFDVKQRNSNLDSGSNQLTNYSFCIPYNKSTTYKIPGLKLNFPEKSVFDSTYIWVNKYPKGKNLLCPTFDVSPSTIPFNKSFAVSLYLPNVTTAMKSKTVLVSINKRGRLSCLGGNWNGDWLTANTRAAGAFSAAYDMVAPVIKPKTTRKNKDLTENKFLSFYVHDNLSGISKIEGYIDGSWVLFEYDPKRNITYYAFDPYRLSFGRTHKLVLEVTDNCSNTSTYKCDFTK